MPRKHGGHTKYTPTLVSEIVQWIEEKGLCDYGGAKLKDLLENFHIVDQTWRRYLEKDDFREKVLEAKETFKKSLSEKIVYSLSRRATGYTLPEQHTEEVPDEGGNLVLKKRLTVQKHFPPDVSAAIFMLTNLQPDTWKTRVTQEQTGNVAVDVNWVEMLKDADQIQDIQPDAAGGDTPEMD